MTAYFRFVLGHRPLVVAGIVAVTALAAWSASRGVMASSLDKLFFGESPEYTRYIERQEQFGTEEINIFAFDAPDLLQPQQLEQLRRIVERIAAIDDVGRVYSVLDARTVEGDGGTLRMVDYAGAAEADPGAIPELIRSLVEDPLVSGVVVSRDGRSSAVILEIDPASQRDLPAERGPAIVGEVLDIFEDEGIAATEVRRAGFLISAAAMVEQITVNITRIFPAVVVILLVTVWLMFRRLWPALLAGVVSLLAVVWTMGFAIQLDREINIFIAMVPGVILIVGFSDVVHLCSAYLIELERGADREQAILRSAEDVGRACFYTSLTTLVGFVCLSLVPTPAFRVLGLVLGFGVAAALWLAMTLVPILFSVARTPKPLRGGATAWIHRGLDRVLGGLQWLALRHPRLVIAGFALVLLATLAGLTRLHIEVDFARRMAEDSQLRQDLSWLDEHFGGTTGLDLYLEADHDGAFLDTETFLSVARYQQALSGLPHVDRSFSMVDLVGLLHAASTDGQAGAGQYPIRPRAIPGYLALFEMSGGEIDRLVAPDHRRLRVTLRLDEEEFRTSAAVARQALALAPGILGDTIEVKPSGLVYMLGDWMDEILAGQRRGLAVSLFTIALMMALALRSLRNGLWSMIPNLFPLLFVGGFVALAWDYVDSDTMMVGLLAIGIGVDDTIHFLVRYRLEASRAPDTATALRRTYTFAGRAIIMTTVILVAGFSPFAISDYYTTHMLGTLLPMCLVVALLADLLLVPALARVGWVRFGRAR
jgi:uncharacterized protein